MCVVCACTYVHMEKINEIVRHKNRDHNLIIPYHRNKFTILYFILIMDSSKNQMDRATS